MAPGRKWLRRLGALGALAALGCAGAVGASASIPAGESWTAHPDEQFLLDVRIRQLRLGEGVRAYNTPEGTCIVFGDFLTTLDVPMKVDLTAKKAQGWAFKEQNRIAIDLAARQASYGARAEPIAPGTVRETPDGWCVDSSALTRWFGIAVKPMTSGSVLMLSSEAKLPVELAMERQQRAAQIKPAKFDLSTLPQVRLPYRMWRAPALDFVVSGGVTYRARDGLKVDRRTSVFAAGEIAHLSYDAQLSTDNKGMPRTLRLRAHRSDPEGGLLGPLNATHFGLGDVAGLDSRLTGSSASGRGAVVTNRPLVPQTAFDRTRFEGYLPSGWDAEIYRNGELLAFAKPTGDQRYRFEDVELLYGENRIHIVLYGPQGQVRTREELINVGQDHVPPGKTWYWAGANQPGRDAASFEHPPDEERQPRAQAAVSVEHGIDERTSAGALARLMLVGDERLSFLEGTVRRSVGSAMIELGVAGESSGGKAARAQLLGKFGSVNVSAEALAANDFHLRADRRETVRDVRLRLDAPLRLGRQVLPAHADFRLTDRDGVRHLEAAGRLAANIDRFNLATDLRYRRQYLRSGPSPPGEVNLAMIGAGRVGNVRLRGSTSFDITPDARFRSAELSAYWSASETTDWEGGVIYDAAAKRARARVTNVRRLNSMAVALTAEAASDGSAALGFNLNFSLDPGGGFKLSRQSLAVAGAVNARVYRDLNDNGVRDPAEPLEKGALITTGPRLSERTTDSQGSVLVGGLAAYTPVTVGIDESSLSDPMLVPKKALQVVVPRPGVPAHVEIGLVGGGDIEGAIVKSGGLGFEGLDLELVDGAGKTIATTRTDFDGFFLFQRVPYGEYRIRLSKETAEATSLAADLKVSVSVSAAKPVVRLGSIHVEPPPRIALLE
ncbi:carboxypeptidase-like regulatory domain-containing protein [Sphingomonas sp.]|uniref:MSCRAMM family protein n=1 Tax=Sphingomonas sp. TaxID=28214 RepID=UPI00180F3ADC|nr:carboxypeptidase-like regulatory domain-containing protein [Sphingomonas sp.]MBA3511237.1 carboxypeptidase regulatory-like domain-containing protein [Sphingomonas sp.]